MSRLRYLTAGESHGPALTGIIEGLPAGMPLTIEHIHADSIRRKMGYGRGNRMKIETDDVKILAGVRRGETLGSPIALYIENRDHQKWLDIMAIEPREGVAARAVYIPRPGHTDRVGGLKYDRPDMRDILERASARETAMRVALGAIARRLLAELGISVASRVVRIGEVVDETPLDADIATLNARVDESPVRVLDPHAAERIVQQIDTAREAGDTLGGVFEVVAGGLPIGLGSHAQWDRRLDGRIGEAFLALNAIKGVELGLGFRGSALPGSAVHDAYFPGENGELTRYGSNRAGGIEGGISTGQPIVVRVAMKPISTLMKPLPSVDLRSGEATNAYIERSDVCAVPAAAVIGESLLALVLADAVLETFPGDTIGMLRDYVGAWREKIRAR
jgi:chorismate synthase